MSKNMSSAVKAQLLEMFAAMLDEPSAEVQIDSGSYRWSNTESGWMEAAPSKGRTVTIKVHGGARELQGPPPLTPMGRAYVDSQRSGSK